jgi:hypothetical protein
MGFANGSKSKQTVNLSLDMMSNFKRSPVRNPMEGLLQAEAGPLR